MLPPCLRISRSMHSRRSSIASSSASSARCAETSRLLAVVAQLSGEISALDARGPAGARRARPGADRRRRGVEARARPRQQLRGAGDSARLGRERLGAARRGRRRAARRAVAGARGRRSSCRTPPGSGAAESISASSYSSRSSSRSRARGELAQLVEPPSSRAVSREGLRAGAQVQRVPGPAEPVEDLELGGRERQLAVLVLAVEGDAARCRGRAGRRRWPSGR